MKKAHRKTTEPEMQAENDFSGAARGKHARRYTHGTNVVVLEPDVAKAFPQCRGGEQFVARAGQDYRAAGKSRCRQVNRQGGDWLGGGNSCTSSTSTTCR